MAVTILSEAEIRQAVQPDPISLRAVESAFEWLDEGRVEMPPVQHLDVQEFLGNIDIRTSYIRGVSRLAVRVSSGFFDNPDRGFPAGNAMAVLLSSETGACEAVLLDNGYLTDLRTGMAGAIAAKNLAPVRTSVVGVLGSGRQARFQIRCLRGVRKLETVLVFGVNGESVQSFTDEVRESSGVDVRAAETVEEVVRESSIVICATPGREPLIEAEWMHPGLHITAIGSNRPGKRELGPGVLQRADLVVCDRRVQCEFIGELQYFDDVDAVELGRIVVGAEDGRISEEQITVCDLTGVGVADTAIANLAYEKAVSLGLGHTI